ncbi:hypothetical protein P5V15_013543 [Pogonomyrmex californicus]
MDEDIVKHKSHRDRNAGRKAEKKKTKKKHVQELTDKQRNPKAFTFHSAVKAERRFRRKQDIETKKQHIPVIDRKPVEPPPVFVAVVGPPKVGKSLLIQCLIKSYIRQPLTNIRGPVTVVTSKKQRVTFMECNNDLNCMIDLAKVADLVLLLVDASFGFELETFEFLNMCQVHGMPKILGVLTHLDQIKNITQMRKTKKLLQHRFWTEVYAGAKLFYLSGLLHGEYLYAEVKNLARFISIMKYRPLTWRTTHPYIVVDRVEDITPPEMIRKNPVVDRTVSLYGYVRGIPLHNETFIHIPGYSEDMKIKKINILSDPCPLPEEIKKRSLVEKEQLIYAPFSGIGGLIYDKDAVYVELGGSHSYKKEDTELIDDFIDIQETLDQKLQQRELKLFSDSAPIKSQDVDENMAPYTSKLITEDKRIRRKVIFNDETNMENAFNALNEDDDNDDETDENNDDDEDESNDDETLEKARKGFKRKNTEEHDIEKKQKRDVVVEDNAIIENDNTSLDESELIYNKKKNLQENVEVYHSLSKKSDELIRDKISKALSVLETTKKNVKQDDESFDEFRDEDSDTRLEMTDAKRTNDFEGNIFEDEQEEKDSDVRIDENEDETPDEFKWKTNLAEKAREAFINRQQGNMDLMKLVYGVFDQKEEKEEKRDKKDEKSGEDIGGIFRMVQEQQQQKIHERELQDQEESVFYPMENMRDWLKEENKTLLMKYFVTGPWKESEDAEELLKLDDENVYGDFEDLETGEKHKTEDAAPKNLSADEEEERKKLLEKKKKLKEQFDAAYDNPNKKTYYDDLKAEAEEQADINKSAFEGLDDYFRFQLEGYRPGMYVRVEIEKVTCELIEYFDPTYPIVIGGLLPGEEEKKPLGLAKLWDGIELQARIKKHRWFPKILRWGDPLIFSVGWRRFESRTLFSKQEDNLSHRFLKYTPEHMPCTVHFRGPMIPEGTGLLAVQKISNKETSFRIAATGSIIETDEKKVKKALKLIGKPTKIYRKTALIKEMFNSAIEVAKFQNAQIQTVSGIRGQIKQAIGTDGLFRATFEDKIKESDIVFCKIWISVNHLLEPWYAPVLSLVLPPGEKDQWVGMRSLSELKREKNIINKPKQNSIYKPIERDVKVFKPLSIPRKLQKELPYRDKPKNKCVPHWRKPKLKESRVAVVREPREENIARMMKMIRKSYNEKKKQEKIAMTKRITERQAQIAEEEAKRMKKQKQAKKEIFRDLSKLEKKKKR